MIGSASWPEFILFTIIGIGYQVFRFVTIGPRSEPVESVRVKAGVY